jgi:hypothetical protein
VRGTLTEGRCLAFEMGEWALANGGGDDFGAGKASIGHDDISQQWVLKTGGISAAMPVL